MRAFAAFRFRAAAVLDAGAAVPTSSVEGVGAEVGAGTDAGAGVDGADAAVRQRRFGLSPPPSASTAVSWARSAADVKEEARRVTTGISGSSTRPKRKSRGKL